MDKYMYWLDNILYLGCPAKCRLLEAFGTPENIYRAKERYLQCILEEKKLEKVIDARQKWDMDGQFEKMMIKEIHMVTIVEEKFPEKLKYIPDPPFALYYKGKLPQEALPSVAVIGARECSEYGRYIAQELGKCLGEHGIQVISGMARGIDGISQTAALEAGGTSYGIMGCGVDICYPAGNRRIYDRLIQDGGIISSYPPGTMPQPKLFPPRNRIVSGLSDVLVVIEARRKSGTSITVEMALEQGRDIYAVPGRVTDRLSDGCNKMLRDGAHVFLSPDDLVEELKHLVPHKMQHMIGQAGIPYENGRRSVSESQIHRLTRAGREMELILSVLDYYPQYVDAIAEKLEMDYQHKFSVTELNVKLMELCLKDLAVQEAPGWFSKCGS